MKNSLLAVTALCLVVSGSAHALTVEQKVTPEYVRSHANEFSVKVARDKNGLLAFTVVRTLKEPRYVVAYLAVRDAHRTLAESQTSAFTKNAENTFHFSIPPEYVATSEFTLGTSGFADSGGKAVPIPGTIRYQIGLAEFVPAELLKSPKAAFPPSAAVESAADTLAVNPHPEIGAVTSTLLAAQAQDTQRPVPAFGAEGIQKRLLKVKSLHVTGRMYRTIHVGGETKREEFPLEFYAERPNRLWRTWHIGLFEGVMNGAPLIPSAEDVKSGFRATDGTRELSVSHAAKFAILKKTNSLAVELQVESELQNDWIPRIIEGSDADFKLVGNDAVDGVEAIKYELVRNRGPFRKTRLFVWVHPQTGLPVRSARYSVFANGNEELSELYERIETNVPPRPDMFSFQPPDGYTFEQNDDPHRNAFQGSFAQLRGGRVGTRFVLAIDDRAALACWINEKPPRLDLINGKPPDMGPLMRMELSSPIIDQPGPKRLCDWYLVRQQGDRDKLWTWSLVLPRDREPVRATEILEVTLENNILKGGGVATADDRPLRFDDERLARLIERLQVEAFSDQPPDEQPFTLTGLRKTVEEILAEAPESDQREKP